MSQETQDEEFITKDQGQKSSRLPRIEEEVSNPKQQICSLIKNISESSNGDDIPYETNLMLYEEEKQEEEK